MRRILTIYITGVLAAGTLAGCADAPPKVVSLGGDAYQLSVAGVRTASQADINIRASSFASDYCAQFGQQVLFRQSRESGDHSWSSKREDLTFVCMSGNDPSFLRAGMKRDNESPVVAQQ